MRCFVCPSTGVGAQKINVDRVLLPFLHVFQGLRPGLHGKPLCQLSRLADLTLVFLLLTIYTNVACHHWV